MRKESRESIVGWLNETALDLRKWVEHVRPQDSSKGRFLWSKETYREASVASSHNIMAGLHKIGASDLITEEDRVEGRKWIESMHRGNSQYHDPALLDRKPGSWPENEDWPGTKLQITVNSYAEGVLKDLGVKDIPPPLPPEGVPGINDAEKAIDYVKSLPWKRTPWGAGSHSMRMCTWLVQWYKEGKIPLKPLADVIQFWYDTQNPVTGFWGDDDLPPYQKINGAFKVFVMLQDQLGLPLFHADKIIDLVLEELGAEDYNQRVGACDEWDNLYVLALVLRHLPERTEEIRPVLEKRLMSYDIFKQDDGGFSYHPDRCMVSWCGIDMTPEIPQGDCMGFNLISDSANVSVDILGMKGTSPFTGEWHLRKPESQKLRESILESLKLDSGFTLPCC